MSRRAQLIAEFAREADTTRTHLARIPDDRFDWRPHVKSSSLGALANHIVDCIRWAAPIFAADELDFDTAPLLPSTTASNSALLALFDDTVGEALQAMNASADDDATGPWRMRFRGRVRFEKARELAFRDMTLSHLIHHRGQLSVYLRLLDIPVPATYGPTADEAY
jgi:uncharacterized damage-inducible protein DinB